MVNGKRHDLFPKGYFDDPSSIIYNLLRGESKSTVPFKLFHRSLRANDKNLTLGQVEDSKFWYL